MINDSRIWILVLVAALSLFWGIYDLRRKRALSAALRVQSWAQVAGGIAGLLCVAAYLLLKR